MTISFAFEGDKKTAWKIEILRLSLSLFTAIGILYFTSAGYTHFHPIIAAAYLIWTIGSIRFPRMSVRRIIQFTCAYFVSFLFALFNIDYSDKYELLSSL